MRLIDADALMDIFADRLALLSERFGKYSAPCGAVAGAMTLIERQPTIEERKTGKWIKFSNSCTIRCNQCGQEMTSLCDIKLPNYCPNCGAKMEG